MIYQTNLKATRLDFTQIVIQDVHPDQTFEPENGLLVVETLSGDEIHRIPLDTLLYWTTTCDPVTG